MTLKTAYTIAEILGISAAVIVFYVEQPRHRVVVWALSCGAYMIVNLSVGALWAIDAPGAAQKMFARTRDAIIQAVRFAREQMRRPL